MHLSGAHCTDARVRGGLPEAHRSHNGLFLVLIINIGGEREENKNVVLAKKAITVHPTYSHLRGVIFKEIKRETFLKPIDFYATPPMSRHLILPFQNSRDSLVL